MRALSVLGNDIRYQLKYGFYLLYAFFSALYIAVLILCPAEYKKIAGVVIVLTDPAMLGSFFIGGIWLLEKGEGLHRFWLISPLRPIEYILSKALSLAFISAISAGVIVWIGIGKGVNYVALSVGVVMGAMLFTVVGLVIATYARSVNHYMLIVSPLEIIVVLPPILAIFGISHPLSDILPSMALWYLLCNAIGVKNKTGVGTYVILGLWLVAATWFAICRLPKAMEMDGGEGV